MSRKCVGFVFLLVVLVAGLVAAACDKPSSTTAPSALPTVADGSLTTSPEMSNAATSATTMAVTGSTNVPTVPVSYCQFTTGNPYPCCQNSPGQYGNCTGGAWEQAKSHWGGSLLPEWRLPAWGDAGGWKRYAEAAGYIVDPLPTSWSIGISTNGAGHVAFVTGVSGNSVYTYEQQCGANYKGGYFSPSPPRLASYFNVGYVRSPIPTVTLMIWSGALSTSNGGTLTVKRGLFGSAATVNFGFSVLRSNVNKGASSYRWTVGGVVSTAGQFSASFPKAGSFPIQVAVTNGMGISTTATATVIVQ